MKKVIRLTERDLQRIVKRVLIEQESHFGVQDNTRVNGITAIRDIEGEKKIDDMAQNLTPQGCSPVNHYFEFGIDPVFGGSYIKEGTCFTKNTKPLSELKPKTKINFPSFAEESNFKGEKWNRVKNSVPDTYHTIDSKTNMLFYCDKNKSPIDNKSNIVFFSAKYTKHSNSQRRYRWELSGHNSKNLEIALQKHFCKK
jgi:hypothetical protein